jgi:hypothetical protein
MRQFVRPVPRHDGIEGGSKTEYIGRGCRFPPYPRMADQEGLPHPCPDLGTRNRKSHTVRCPETPWRCERGNSPDEDPSGSRHSGAGAELLPSAAGTVSAAAEVRLNSCFDRCSSVGCRGLPQQAAILGGLVCLRIPYI